MIFEPSLVTRGEQLELWEPVYPTGYNDLDAIIRHKLLYDETNFREAMKNQGFIWKKYHFDEEENLIHIYYDIDENGDIDVIIDNALRNLIELGEYGWKRGIPFIVYTDEAEAIGLIREDSDMEEGIELLPTPIYIGIVKDQEQSEEVDGNEIDISYIIDNYFLNSD